MSDLVDRTDKLSAKAHELAVEIEETEEIDVDQLIDDLEAVLSGLKAWRKQGSKKLEQWAKRATDMGDSLEELSVDIADEVEGE